MNELKYDQEQKSALIFLEGPVTIQNINDIKNLFTEALEKSGRIYVNQEKADEFDLTYLQLLVSFRRSAIESGKEIKIIGCDSESFNTVATNSGFPINIFRCCDQQVDCLGGKTYE